MSDAQRCPDFRNGVIESQDLADTENSLTQTKTGYTPEAITDDGMVGASDNGILFNQVYNTRIAKRPN